MNLLEAFVPEEGLTTYSSGLRHNRYLIRNQMHGVVGITAGSGMNVVQWTALDAMDIIRESDFLI